MVGWQRERPGRSLCSRNATRKNNRIVKLRAVFVHARTMGPIQATPEKDACATRQRFGLDRGVEEKKNEE